MTKLSEPQAILLTAAAQRSDGNLLPLPGSLRGGAAAKVVAALLARGLVEKRIVEGTAEAEPALNTLCRDVDDGRGILLRITAAGHDALCIKGDCAAVAGAEAATDSAPSDGGAAVESAHTSLPRRVRARARGHEAGAAHRHPRPSRGRHDRRDRRGDRLAAAHRPRGLRRRAEEAAWAGRPLGEDRGARPGLSNRPLTST